MDEVRRQGHRRTVNQLVKRAKVGTIDEMRQISTQYLVAMCKSKIQSKTPSRKGKFRTIKGSARDNNPKRCAEPGKALDAAPHMISEHTDLGFRRRRMDFQNASLLC